MYYIEWICDVGIILSFVIEGVFFMIIEKCELRRVYFWYDGVKFIFDCINECVVVDERC